MKHIKSVSVVKASAVIDDVITIIQDAIEELARLIKKDNGS